MAQEPKLNFRFSKPLGLDLLSVQKPGFPRALHWVPMPTHTHGFWVGMGAMLEEEEELRSQLGAGVNRASVHRTS